MIMLSPGVETRELDYSMYIRQISTAVLALVGGATKGEVNKPILITSPEDYVRNFGEPVRDVYAGYAALRFLSEGNRMWFTRIVDGNEAKAETDVGDDTPKPAVLVGDPVENIGDIEDMDSIGIDYTDGENTTQSITVEFVETVSTITDIITAINDEVAIGEDIASEGDNDNIVLTSQGDGADAAVTITAVSLSGTADLGFEVNDEATGSDGAVITFETKDPGSWFNNMDVVLHPFDDDEFYVILLTEEGLEVERTLVSADPTFDNYIEDELDDSSDYLTAIYDPDDSFQLGADDDDLEGTLTGGEDGIDELTYTDYEGTVTIPEYSGGAATGLQVYRNVEEIEFNILAAPDVSYSDVISSELIDICETRGDCMALIDPPMELGVQDVVEWHNGDLEGGDYPSQALSSSYAATYWPWLKYSDPFHGGSIWLPPSGEISATYARNDRMAYPWFAPAGHQRGSLNKPIDLEHSANSGARDYLYGDGDAVNPIVNFTREGITVWGQRTLQRRPSALDRVNVRRLLLMMRKAIAASTKYLVFEPNDEFTWNEWEGMVEPYLEGLKNSRALYDYMVQMDENTVTPQAIDQGRMPGQIIIKPTKAAEFITIDFVLVRTGAEIEEYLA